MTLRQIKALGSLLFIGFLCSVFGVALGNLDLTVYGNALEGAAIVGLMLDVTEAETS